MTESRVPGDTSACSDGPVPSDASIRRGSPFADADTQRSGEDAMSRQANSAIAWQLADSTFEPEWGMLRAANWASAWVALFGLACLSMFPAGGLIVAAWGGGLATTGLFSTRPRTAAVLLLAHAGLFWGCYQSLF